MFKFQHTYKYNKGVAVVSKSYYGASLAAGTMLEPSEQRVGPGVKAFSTTVVPEPSFQVAASGV